MTTLPESENSRSDLTPLMRQYGEIKARNPNAILLYRMGDFYEMFNDDARIASKVLGLTLTSRNHGAADNTPLAGFPFHALDRYAHRLVKAGYKIAICEQTEDPKAAKGIVKRDIIEVISAGTATEGAFIEEKANKYIMGVFRDGSSASGVAICDLSTGQFEVEELGDEELKSELVRIGPAELLVPEGDEQQAKALCAENYHSIVVSSYDKWKFSYDIAAGALRDHFEAASLSGFGLEPFRAGVCAAGALLLYLKEQKKNDLRHISAITPRSLSEFAELDPSTIRNLELLRPMHTDETGGTLVSVLDKTNTAMGSRLLKRLITRPLKRIGAIQDRLACVEWFKKDPFARGETELLLKRISDIERLIGRVVFERANGRDLIALAGSFNVFNPLVKALQPARRRSSKMSPVRFPVLTKRRKKSARILSTIRRTRSVKGALSAPVFQRNSTKCATP